MDTSRKSIVLLITLFFISSISILILQNLDDTDKFLDEVSRDTSLSQIQITIDNVKKEIPDFFNKNKENIDEILENTSIVPFEVGDVNLLLNITEYTLPPFNINKLNTAITTSESFINNINYKYDFLQLVNKNKPYSNNNQIQQIIDEYIKLTKDSDILNIKDDFTYMKDANGTKLIKCDCLIDTSKTDCKISFIFDLNKSIKDFTIVSIF